MWYVNSRAIIERNNQHGVEIVVQNRSKPDQPATIELPGGRIEPYESLTEALRREVKEETGLDIVEIEGYETKVDTAGIESEFEVECIRPFAAYQTIRGPFDSVGYYFRCKVSGTLLTSGDGTTNVRWIPVDALRDMMREDPLQFSSVDRAGILFYLKHLESKN
ncbi:NUDIX hydrolase [Paenibacillus profundus]|uniref:NUDIX hydrolase n=1 Tax=Paenibacillus profundus TaxID=1173085 RepID=A0ABS8YGM7_9BACL|nr:MULTISPECIES: NUDIX hydrolase [Paenibacillus]MCE5171133.1 NUDIX hydrolase [Paenibacillus profundus]